MNAQTLDAAFRATTYRVHTADGAFDLRIGVANSAFAAFLRRRNISCWGVLTACNPGAVRDDGGNAQRQQRLRERLEELALSFVPACSLAGNGAWPAEPGFLLLHVREEAVRELAAEFSQLAFICGNIEDVPRLIYVQQVS